MYFHQNYSSHFVLNSKARMQGLRWLGKMQAAVMHFTNGKRKGLDGWGREVSYWLLSSILTLGVRRFALRTSASLRWSFGVVQARLAGAVRSGRLLQLRLLMSGLHFPAHLQTNKTKPKQYEIQTQRVVMKWTRMRNFH